MPVDLRIHNAVHMSEIYCAAHLVVNQPDDDYRATPKSESESDA